jgi:hypothetical protein
MVESTNTKIMEGAKAFLEREYNGFFDEFDEQELYDIVVAMEDYASQQVKPEL